MKFKLIILLLTLTFGSNAQNLVPNPGFETYTDCPFGHSLLSNAVGWFSPDTGRTPDYLHECAAGNIFSGIPGSWSGDQTPHGGAGYAGFINKFVSLDGQPYIGMEKIAVQLTSTLTIGTTYYVKFYVSLAECSHWTSEALGLKFFVDEPNWNGGTDYTEGAHIHDIDYTFITDKNSWTYISGQFVADSAYNYLVIGDFDTVGDTTLFLELSGGLNPWGPGSAYTGIYYYVDDVCVSSNPNECGELIDLSTGSIEKDYLISIYPNPSDKMVNIDSSVEIKSTRVLDFSGRVLITEHLSPQIINLEYLASGTYTIEFHLSDNSVIYKQVIRK